MAPPESSFQFMRRVGNGAASGPGTIAATALCRKLSFYGRAGPHLLSALVTTMPSERPRAVAEASPVYAKGFNNPPHKGTPQQ